MKMSKKLKARDQDWPRRIKLTKSLKAKSLDDFMDCLKSKQHQKKYKIVSKKMKILTYPSTIGPLRLEKKYCDMNLKCCIWY